VTICFFEDGIHKFFGPLTATRPVFDILCGTSTLLEKAVNLLVEERPVHLYVREVLAEVVEERHDGKAVNKEPEEGEVLLVNGSLVVDNGTAEILKRLPKHTCLTKGGRVAAARIPSKVFSEDLERALKGGDASQQIIKICSEVKEVEALRLLSYPWELVDESARMIVLEAGGERVTRVGFRGDVYRRGDVAFEDYVSVDGSKGPVVFDDGVRVESFVKVVGPCYIGRETVIYPHTNIVSSSIGPVCRVGGEVENTVIIGYSNKRHYGFLGHSVVGEWVNMGAGTTTSNLKNTYGTFRVDLAGERIDTGRQFLGAFIGDHVKTSIGCMVSGGCFIGVSSHIHRRAYVNVPAFTIHVDGENTELQLDSALQTAVRMMWRRGMKPSEKYLKLLKKLYSLTEDERRLHGVRKGRATFYMR